MNMPARHIDDHPGDERARFESMFNQFFTDLMTIFPAWRQAFPTTSHLEAGKRQWALALRENGITTSGQISAGLRRARAQGGDFFPAPGKFVEWCKPAPEDFGLPAPDAAYREAVIEAGRIGKRSWTHPAIHEAATRVGLFELSRMTDADARKAFAAAYREVCSLVMSRKLQLALPAPDSGRTDKSDPAKLPRAIVEKKSPEAHLADMRRMLGIRRAQV